MMSLEATATSGDISVVSIVCLVMMAGCAFGIALGYPWKWMATAAVLYLLAVGYPGSAVMLLGGSLTVRTYAPHMLRWLESLDIGRVEAAPSGARFPKTGSDRTNRGRGTDRSTSHATGHSTGRRNQSEQHWSFEDFVAAGSNPAPPPQKRRRATPENVLGLGAGFTMKDLDAARRKMAKKFHPDLHRRASVKTQQQMAEKMRRINAAYETLKSQVA